MTDFQRLLKRVPVGWQTMVAQGVNFLANELEAEEVKMVEHPNGVSIAIITDDGNIEKALKFWRKHVEPELDGE